MRSRFAALLAGDTGSEPAAQERGELLAQIEDRLAQAEGERAGLEERLAELAFRVETGDETAQDELASSRSRMAMIETRLRDLKAASVEARRRREASVEAERTAKIEEQRAMLHRLLEDRLAAAGEADRLMGELVAELTRFEQLGIEAEKARLTLRSTLAEAGLALGPAIHAAYLPLTGRQVQARFLSVAGGLGLRQWFEPAFSLACLAKPPPTSLVEVERKAHAELLQTVSPAEPTPA